MPVNRRYPLKVLLEACDYYVAKKRRMTFEYILIAGVNDTDEQARELAKIARRLSAKINLIPYNTVESLDWSRPSRPRQEKFQSILREHGVVATLRREKGHDIAAACGQLARLLVSIIYSGNKNVLEHYPSFFCHVVIASFE